MAHAQLRGSDAPNLRIQREMRRTHGRRVSGLEALVVEGEQRLLLLMSTVRYA